MSIKTTPKIAILITCFNRKVKTLKCLSEIYTEHNINNYDIETFIVDGGSKDGTPDAIKEKFPQANIKICNNFYWAQGMREAWNIASLHDKFDFYLLLNDDTTIYNDTIDELIKADMFSKEKIGKQGIYVGSTCSPNDKKFTYGGIKLIKWGKRAGIKIVPNGEYQYCDLANANILMVSYEVFKTIGGFTDEYIHGIADFDYTLKARTAGFPILVLPKYSGECINDHGKPWLSQKKSIKERIKYLYSPKGLAYKQQLHYIRKYFPTEYYEMQIKLWLKTLFPFLWTLLKK